MPAYHVTAHAAPTSNHPHTVTLLACDRCGALTTPDSQPAHDRWHEEQL